MMVGCRWTSVKYALRCERGADEIGLSISTGEIEIKGYYWVLIWSEEETRSEGRGEGG